VLEQAAEYWTQPLSLALQIITNTAAESSSDKTPSLQPTAAKNNFTASVFTHSKTAM